jgi:hypothetical protein
MKIDHKIQEEIKNKEIIPKENKKENKKLKEKTVLTEKKSSHKK